jgi:flavin reductase (DIM6/NTAB) family NADH-FMN oxidoreductase RutF
VTIHSEHPFATPEPERDPVRRLRGRLGGVVSLWTTGAGAARSGLTVSSLLVASGEPGHILALVDPDSDFVREVSETRIAVVELLSWRHQQLAEAFAGLFPAPGGVFRLGEWVDTEWGPRLRDVATWAGVRLVEDEPRQVGWSMLLDLTIEHVEIGGDDEPLVHRRGRYQRPDTAEGQTT